MRTATTTTGFPVSCSRRTSVFCALLAVTLYVATTTASASAAAVTAPAMAVAEGAVPVVRAVVVKPNSASSAAITFVVGPSDRDGEAGSGPTTSSLR